MLRSGPIWSKISKFEKSSNLRGLVAGTMIFDFVLKNDTESTYFLSIFDFFFINRSGPVRYRYRYSNCKGVPNYMLEHRSEFLRRSHTYLSGVSSVKKSRIYTGNHIQISRLVWWAHQNNTRLFCELINNMQIRRFVWWVHKKLWTQIDRSFIKVIKNM